MHLKVYLEREGLSPASFAALIGCSAEAVRRYVAGERIPDRDRMINIKAVSNGAVTPNDFYPDDGVDHGDLDNQIDGTPASGNVDQLSAQVVS